MLVETGAKSQAVKDEIALLTLLIEKYDGQNNLFEALGPIELLKSLMKGHSIKAVELAKLLNVSPGLVSDILKYKKGLSKDSIRILAEKFKLKQEAFSRKYELKVAPKKLPSRRAILKKEKTIA